MAVTAGKSKSEKRKGSGVMGVVVLVVVRGVVDLVVAVVVPFVVVVVVAVVGVNLLRLLNSGAMSFGLFFDAAEKLAFFAGLKGRKVSSCYWLVTYNMDMSRNCRRGLTSS